MDPYNEPKDIPASGLPAMPRYSEIVPTYLRARGIFQYHVQSYNNFIDNTLPKIVAANSRILSEVDPSFYLKFEKIYLGKPEIEEQKDEINVASPHECRLRDLTYSAPMYVDVEYFERNKILRRRGMKIGKMPVMVKSKYCILSECKSEHNFAEFNECPLDPGGYFIARGQEKVILMQEQLIQNRIILERDDKKDTISCQVYSTSDERKSRIVVIYKKDQFFLQHNSFTEDIPLAIVFRAMGIANDESIVSMMGTSQELCDLLFFTLNVAHEEKVFSETQALTYMGRRLKNPRRIGNSKAMPADEARDHIMMSVLPHVPAKNFNFQTRAIFLSVMVKKIIAAINTKSISDDRDFWGNKRLELAGSFISLLFEDLFKRLCTEFKKRLDKYLSAKPVKTFDTANLLMQSSSMITNGIEAALTSGHWNIQRFKVDRKGVTQVLSRQSYLSALGMMTRVESQVAKTRKTSGPRSIHLSQFGMVCPCDTPEGESCGLTKNLALMCHVTTETNDKELKSMIYRLGISSVDNYDFQESCVLCFLNGNLIGYTQEPQCFIDRFKYRRRNRKIYMYASIYRSSKDGDIYISSDAGRLVRPVFILNNTRLFIYEALVKEMAETKNFDVLVSAGAVEFLDVNEENDAYIALKPDDVTPQHTHLEIENYAILGVCAATVPYCNHNQSPRNTYQCAMGKQAMGAIGYNQFKRIDTIQYNLVYGQKPLVSSEALQMINYEKLPSGHNATVCVVSYSGFDIEDAIVLNQASVDRGFGRCVVYKQAKTTLQKYPKFGGITDIVKGPSKLENGRAIYKDLALESDGMARVGGPVDVHQTLLQKSTPMQKNFDASVLTHDPNHAEFEYGPEPLSFQETGRFYVDKAMLTSDRDHNKLVKFSLRQTRTPEVGDKFSSRHGQKGVTGLIVPQEDLPFNENGISPDLIMNPHGFPSRMTVGKLLELLGSKAAAVDGHRKYGTAFKSHPHEVLMDILETNGYSYEGKDLFYSGITGEPLECYVYSGPVFYQKLKHMVVDKLNVRSKGRNQFLTRQPTEGRSRGGGLRVGEMERDCLIGHGVSQLLIERLCLSSDAFPVKICIRCGFLVDHKKCNTCAKRDYVKEMKLPYAFKLLMQELMAMGIAPRLEFTKHSERIL